MCNSRGGPWRIHMRMLAISRIKTGRLINLPQSSLVRHNNRPETITANNRPVRNEVNRRSDPESCGEPQWLKETAQAYCAG